jgi:hypothetical protein
MSCGQLCTSPNSFPLIGNQSIAQCRNKKFLKKGWLKRCEVFAAIGICNAQAVGWIFSIVASLSFIPFVFVIAPKGLGGFTI